ncbi:TRAP transporter substrate-binding protein [Comamonas odontotermitis]|uniref:TRAP transporter substrate-binding protein n=1 Tax=Comamonas odontotermitis TaxID=379895 RepID=UPI00366CC8B4
MKTEFLKAVLAIGAAAVIGLAAPGAVYAQAKPVTLKLAHGATADQAIGKAMLKFGELVAQKSGGAAKVDVHLAGSLYNERTSVEAIVNGAVDFGGSSNANWAAFTRTLMFMDLPYVISDEAAFKRVLHGRVGEEIRKRFEKDGFKLVMILDNGGFRDIVNNKRPIRTPADLKGLKFRTTASPVEIAMFRNWGAIPTAIDWAEVYNGLGSGVVDGEFVMPTWMATAKHYEVLKYATRNRAAIGVQTLAMRKDRFESLPPNIQSAIIAAAKEAEVYGNELDSDMTEKARAYAKSLGVVTYEPTEQEMQQWRTTGRAVWKEFENKIDKDLVKMVLDAQSNG